MHIVIGILGSIITILILLNRLAEAGIDLGGLNPYLWNRRRKWRKQYLGNPLYKIESPMDATAILMLAAAKADGDLAKEDKNFLLQTFEQKFGLSKKDAAGLLISSGHLLGDGNELRQNVKKFLKPSEENFSATQTQSALELIESAAGKADEHHPNAEALLADIRGILQLKPPSEGSWK